MTDTMKKFLEEAGKDTELMEKMKQAETVEAAIALAAEKGFILTAEDLKPDQPTGELNEDELDAVAGGKACVCVAGGGGEKEGSGGICMCIAFGGGKTDYGNRCTCLAFGYGDE